MYFWMCSWLLIIPKLLIDDSGPIAILFDSFFGTSDFFTKSGPADPVFITKICQKYEKLMGTSLNIVFFISEKLKPENPGNHVQCALLFFLILENLRHLMFDWFSNKWAAENNAKFCICMFSKATRNFKGAFEPVFCGATNVLKLNQHTHTQMTSENWNCNAQVLWRALVVRTQELSIELGKPPAPMIKRPPPPHSSRKTKFHWLHKFYELYGNSY